MKALQTNLDNQLKKVKRPKEFTNQIIQGDCLEVMKNMPANSIGLIVTSLPYNRGIKYDVYDDNKSIQEYSAFLREIFKEAFRILKLDGRICINIQPNYTQYFPSHIITAKIMLDIGFKWRNEHIWNKQNYRCKPVMGSNRRPSAPVIKATCEYIYVFVKERYKKDKVGAKVEMTMTQDEYVSFTLDLWNIQPETMMIEEYGHPAMFPLEIPRRLIKLYSFQDETVLDMFNGAGTTTLAAHLLKRKYIGIDISEEYCKTARKRIKESKV